MSQVCVQAILLVLVDVLLGMYYSFFSIGFSKLQTHLDADVIPKSLIMLVQKIHTCTGTLLHCRHMIVSCATICMYLSVITTRSCE